LLLAGCASLDIDREVAALNAAQPAFTQGALTIGHDEAGRQARAQQTDRLLTAPLGRDEAVRLAMANSPELQALLTQHLSDLAAAQASGRIANPVFTLERVRNGDELELGRLLSFGLLDVITWPQRHALARQQEAQVRVRLSATLVDQVSAVRQAWVRAVAAQQVVGYAYQVQQAAQASAELARRMQATGNFSRLQRARQHAFYADATARLAGAQHAATVAREDLVRRLGLDDTQAQRLRLPERLPDLPAQPMEPAQVAGAAREQRLDWQLARLQLEAAGRAQRLDLVSSLVDVEAGVRRDTHFDAGQRSNPRGWELALRLPLFDWGSARRAAMNAQSLAAAHRYDAVTRSAASQLREAYSAYRTSWELVRHYRDEVVPLRKTVSDENLLRYNGMLIGVFELLADTREQVGSVMAAIDAQQQFWLADAALASALTGRPAAASLRADSGSTTASPSEPAGH
jgi:outer membrane protein TolC